MRIQYKILIWFLLVATIPFVAIQLFVSFNVSAELRDRLVERLEAENHKQSLEVSSFIHKHKSESLSFTKLPPISPIIRSVETGNMASDGSTRAQWEGRLAQIFSAFMDVEDDIAQIRFLNVHGFELVRVDQGTDGPEVTPRSGLQDKSSRDYFKKGIWYGEGSVYVSDLDLNVEHGQIEEPHLPVSRYVAPVYLGGKVSGAIVINVQAERVLENMVLNKEVTIIDQDGYYVYNADRDKRFTKQLNQSNYFTDSGGLLDDDIRKEVTAGHLFNDSDQTHVFWTRVMLDEVDKRSLVVISSATEADITALVDEFNQTLIIISLLAFLGVLISAYFLSKTISNPINKLQKVAEDLFNGNMLSRSDIKSKDEIGSLSKTFNKMAERITDSQANLEQKVTDRTKDLDKSKRDLEDQQKAVLNILDDVTSDKEKIGALAKDLDKFKLAVDNTSDHVIITDSEGIILYANKSVERITGYKPEYIIGKKAGSKDLWGGLMDLDFYKKLWHTIKEDKVTFSGQIKNRRKGGQEYFVSATISPIVDENNEVKFFVGIERDITKEHDVDQAKTEFVSLASHQLRTPLSAIRWYSEMMADTKPLNTEQKEYLKEIHHGAKRMIDLVGSLLSVSRLELGTTVVQLEDVSLGIVAQDATKDLQIIAKEHEVAITLNVMKDVPTIKVDAKLTRVIVENLLTNAIKYTKAGGKISVNVSTVPKGKVFGGKKMAQDVVGVSVADTGVGIPKAQQGQIFQKLFRADNVRELDTNGTGLGLYLVKLSAERMGGSIWFESVEGEGTTFYVFLPLNVDKELPKASSSLE